MARPGFTEDGKRIQPVANYNPVTGEYEVGGGGGGSISAEATAAPPSYEEGASAPLSMDLAGNLRIGGVISAETATTATAAAPTYVEASADNALSVNLTGDLRTIAKQSGAWTVAATQSGTWNVTNISGTISLPTGAATLAGQTAVTGTKAAGTAAASSILTGGVFNTSLPTLTNGQQAAAQMDANGRIYTTATVTTLPALVAGSAIIGNVRIDQTTGGTTNGVVLKKASGDPVDTDLPAEVAFTKSTAYFNAAAGSTKYLVAAGAQTLTDYFIENPDASAKAYLQFFNAATIAGVTLGTTAPVRSIGLAAGEKANLSGLAIDFPLGLVIAGTTTATGNTTATTGLVVNLGYKAG